MLAIKLKLIGKRGQHSFRVIVQEKRAKLQGKFVDDLGWYNPHVNQIKIDQTKLKDWLAKGAVPTETVRKLTERATDTSEVQEYKGRTRPKTKKKEKIAAQGGASEPKAAPAAEAEEQPASQTEAATEGETAPQGEVAPETPTEEPAAQSGDSAEKSEEE